MRVILTVISIFCFCVGISVSQNMEIDNQNWQVITYDTIQFRLPDTWENDGNVWSNPLNSGRLFITFNDTSISDIFSNADTVSEENIVLPIGEALKIGASDNNVEIQNYVLQDLILLASIPLNIPESEQITFFETIAQIANTLAPIQENDDTWSLFANADATIFLRTPLSWSKEISADDTLSVNQIFDDALISITYRDLGRPFELAEVTDQFETIYRSNSYDIQVQDIVNLPVGEALFFRLGDVRVTSSSTHIQLHYAIARENYLIVVTAGADETYFAEYEPILLQIMDTIHFQIP